MSDNAEPISNDLNRILRSFSTVPLSDTTPAAPGGSTNINWQFDEFGNISASVPGGGGTPGSPDKSIQTNQSGVFTGNADLTYDPNTGIMAVGGTPQVPLFIAGNQYTIAGPLNMGPQESTLGSVLQNHININDNNVIVAVSVADKGTAALSVYHESTATTIQEGIAVNAVESTHGTISCVGLKGEGIATPGTGITNTEFTVGVLATATIGQFATFGQDLGSTPKLVGVYAGGNSNWGIKSNAAICAGFFSENQSSIGGTLNAAFYAQDQGSNTGDYAFFCEGSPNNDFGAGITQLGIIVPKTIYTAAGTALPAASLALKGARATVGDATAPTWMTAYTSGGTVTCPVFCDGTTWLTA